MLNHTQNTTHRQSLENFQMKETGGTEYINVYMDTEGKRHYSSEEFAIGQEGIFSYDDALEEAARLTSEYDWEYVRTLTINERCTDKAEIDLEHLERAREIITEFGGNYSGLTIEATQEAAAEILAGDRVMGRI